MKFKLLAAILVFFSVLPILATACTTHDQCSDACNSLAVYLHLNTCPFGVYSCMVGDCCIGQCNYNGGGNCFCLQTTYVDIKGNVCPSNSVCESDCMCHPQTQEQKGTLNVKVTDCATSRPIQRTRVDVSASIDPTKYTDSSGYTIFTLSPNTYTITASTTNYYSKSTSGTVYCSQTTNVNICLDQIPPTPTCTITVNDIMLEEVSVPIDPQTFCYGDTLRARASISVGGRVDPRVILHLYVDGSFYDIETLNVGYGSNTVTFDKLIYSSSLWTGQHTVKVTASVDCDGSSQRTESFYVKDCRQVTCSNPYGQEGQTRCDYSAKQLLKCISGQWRCSGDYCSNCNSHCGDNSCNCGETQSTCPRDCGYPQVCTPGAIINRHCECLTQIGYQKCNNDGSGWDNVVESCPSGYTCSSGYCGYTPKCSEGYLDEYSCSGNYKQRKYQYSDCSTTWANYELCSNGCSGGSCQSAPQCSEGYLDNFRCSGSWRQRQYKYSDCSTGWINYEYCSNYCSDNSCVYEGACSVKVTASTPEDARVGETVSTTIKIKNTGDKGGYVSIDAYVCTVDPNCHRMNCDGGDPTVYVSGHSTYTLVCSAEAREESMHEIKVVYNGCGDGTIYSGTFEVREKFKPSCTAQYFESYRCSDGWKQQLYKYSNCSTAWVSLEHCSYGCSENACLPKPITTPQGDGVYTSWTVLLKPFTSYWFAGFLLLSVSLALLLLILSRKSVCYRSEPGRRNRPEWFDKE